MDYIDMRIVFLTITIMIYSGISSLYSQNNSTGSHGKDHKNNAVYLELLGNNGVYSFNYERTLYKSVEQKEKIALSAGFNIPFSIFQTKIPIELKYIIGATHAFEAGAGYTLGTAN